MENRVKSYLKSSRLYPVLLLDSFISDDKRNFLINLNGILILFLLLPILFFQLWGITFLPTSLPVLAFLVPRLWGIIFILLALYLVLAVLDFYFNDSFYFENVALNNYQQGDKFTITVGRILLKAKNGDILRGFLNSLVGREIVARLGLKADDVADFLAERQTFSSDFPAVTGDVLKLHALVKFLYQTNPDFSLFLKKFGIGENDLLGATSWVVYRIEFYEYKKRWWSKSNLDRIPGLAKDWGFGSTFVLDKYGWDMLGGLQYSVVGYDYSTRNSEVLQMENILTKGREANVLLVGGSREEALDIVWHLVKKIQNRTVVPALEYKRPVLFNASVFLSNFKERSMAEKEMLKIFAEAEKAGNVILVLDDLYNLLSGFQSFGSSFLGLAESYLKAGAFQIIALASTDVYHRFLAINSGLMTFFDRILVSPLGADVLIHSLEETVWQLEAKHKIFFTHQALGEIISGADSYFAESSSGDKAVDLLTEIVPWAISQDLEKVGRAEVQKFLSIKTNVPLGEIDSEERSKLQNLELEIHKRVVGQDEAVKLVSGALRRSRAGVRNLNRPIGSFLFLGPTGVGKTETAKALAEVVFGHESNLLRLDMSEFQADDSLTKLIGSFESGQTGILVDLLREHPYGVCLLDEFEKTNRDVLNLFLQILDEGVFSDMGGKRVNARNIIFIATSNAGAELIWENFRQGKRQENTANNLINHIVAKGIFRPELLNRFDATVVFEPLSPESLKEISRLLLTKLAKRLSNQGLELAIKDDLVQAVATLGANEVFGARPMQRFIQDKIEQPIAEAIIAKTLGAGSRVEFDTEAGFKLIEPRV